jgi:hypothetical protein
MPLKEIAWKSLGFLLVCAALAVGGALVLGGSHAFNDYFYGILGWGLIALAVITAGFGALVVGGVLYDERKREEEKQVHITPRVAPPAPPPPWGMSDVGRPRGGVVQMSGPPQAHGGGQPRVVSVAVSNIDGPLFIAGLLAWTVIFLIFFAPH